MAVNGFLQFAGESTNIITDEEYAESSVRVNGVTSGKAVSTLHNKMYLQWSTIAYVIGQLIADAGYAATDSDVDVLLGNLKSAIGATVGGKIFTAYYGTTTYAEVESAISAGKIVFVHDIPAAGEETLYVYEYSDNSNIYFSSAYSKNDTEGSFGWLKIDTSNTWTKGSADAMIKGVDYVIAGQKAGEILGIGATAEGHNVIASGGYSHAENVGSVAIGTGAHAEGATCTAQGSYSHAEGFSTKAVGYYSHSEGANTEANGNRSHAEGYYAIASGDVSHAEGLGTIAQGVAQHVGGKYNIADSTSLEIIGNGASDVNRSNARTLDPDGNEVLAGKLTVGVRGSNDMDVATLVDAYAAYVTETESGDIVSITDGASNIPVKSFVGSIIPQQNLNGYDNPWPAGGGKNKLPLPSAATANGVTLAVNTDGSIKLTGTATAAATFDFISSGFDSSAYAGYIFSGGANWAGSSNGYSVRVMSGSTASQVITANETAIVDNGSGLRLTLRVGSGTAFPSGGLVLFPMLRASGTDNTFAPYSNVCPISGWTDANIYRGVTITDWITGKAINENGVIVDNSAFEISPFVPVESGKPYLIRHIRSGGDGSTRTTRIHAYTTAQTWIEELTSWNSTPDATTAVTLAIPNNCAYIRASVVTSGSTMDVSKIIVLAFGSTVYAGTITALGGRQWKIQPTHAVVDMGSLTYTYNSTYSYFAANPTGISTTNANITPEMYCSIYGIGATRSVQSWGNAPDMTIGQRSSYANIIVKDSRYTDPDQYKTAVTGQTLVYELATLPDPIIITRDDLQTLLGSNIVWTNCGSVTDITYRADTKLYIDKIIGSGSQTVVIDGGSF